VLSNFGQQCEVIKGMMNLWVIIKTEKVVSETVVRNGNNWYTMNCEGKFRSPKPYSENKLVWKVKVTHDFPQKIG